MYKESKNIQFMYLYVLFTYMQYTAYNKQIKCAYEGVSSHQYRGFELKIFRMADQMGIQEELM